MTRRLLTGFLSVTVFVMIVLGVPLGVVFARLERSHLIADVRHDAALLAMYSVEPLRAGDEAALQHIAGRYQDRSGGRVVIVDTAGTARADSSPSGPHESFSARPEVEGALAGQEAEGFRHSDTAGGDLFYVAVPVNSGGVIRGAIRVTHPAAFVNDRIARAWELLGVVGVVVLAGVLLLSRAVARSVTAPVRRLAAAASAVGEGRLDVRVGAPGGPPELRVLTRVFDEMTAKVERLVGAQREFVADVSHQLRTPLAALRVRLEVAARCLPPPASEDIEAALIETQRLARLVEGLLVLASVDHRQGAPEVVDVAGAVAGRREAWLPLAEEQGITLVVAAGPGPVHAVLTPGALEQALDNLIANALDATPPGRAVTLSAGVSSAWPGQSVEVHVTDQGPGMPAGERALAFERRYRAPVAGSSLGGSGLGLAIVRRLVESDGGEVTFAEAPGGGLDVRLRWPAGVSTLAVPPARRALTARGRHGAVL